MRLRVLGCSGGIGGQQNRTTSFLLDDDILIDAGTGVGDLSLSELTLIDHIFITHSHLDHVNSIAFFVDFSKISLATCASSLLTTVESLVLATASDKRMIASSCLTVIGIRDDLPFLSRVMDRFST